MKSTTGQLIPWLFASALLLLPTEDAYAKPGFGGNCADCHSSQAGHMTVSGNSGLANPAGGIGELKRFVAEAGASALLTINVTNGADKYNVVVRGVDGAGVTNAGNILDGTPDPTWTSRYSGTLFTALSSNGASWTGAKSWSFNLGVPAATPLDFYILSLETVGKSGSEWMQTEQVYLQIIASPPLVPGDTNNDGLVSLIDLVAVQNNIGSHVVGAAHGDFNGDGQVTLADVSILASNYGRRSVASAVTAVPEPSAAVLVALGCALAASIAVRRGRRAARRVSRRWQRPRAV